MKRQDDRKPSPELGYSTTTIGQSVNNGNGQAPPAMNDLQLDGPGQWGRLISSSRNGRAQVYELDFGRGHKILTHVFWASSEERDRDNNDN